MATGRRLAMALAACGALAAVPAADALAVPIPTDPGNARVPAFTGAPATPRRLISAEPPRHPFMAPNGRSNIHNDAFQTDSYRVPGPLGRGMSVTSNLQTADCASVTFDSRGHLVTICVGVQGPRLVVMDARTLAVLATMNLPGRSRLPGANLFTDFSGGGYFYLDQLDRAVFSTTDRRIFVVAVRTAGGKVVLRKDREYSLRGAVVSGDGIESALPDWAGRIWFVTESGVVGTVDPASGAVHSTKLGEGIANSFSVDQTGGVYVVTDRALYRLDAGAGGQPVRTWRAPYPNSGIAKPGQVGAGSGTTPTVMQRGYVAITDNADPMDVVVYRRAKRVKGRRQVCRQPVFRKGASATDQSLVAARDSLVVENNYGYKGPTSVMNGKTTEPGITRVDVKRRGRGCHVIWRSSERAPSVVPKLSLETGLVYTYTKPRRSDSLDPWYLTALDFCGGRTVYKRLSGTGLGYNNNYAPVTLGPDGTAYVGTLGGIVALRDAGPPSGPPASARRGCVRPRLRLGVRYRRGHDRRHRRCARSRVRATLSGRDRALVRRVSFRVGRRVRRDLHRPYTKVVTGRPRGRRSRRRAVVAKARLEDGRLVRLRKRFRVCAAKR